MFPNAPLALELVTLPKTLPELDGDPNTLPEVEGTAPNTLPAAENTLPGAEDTVAPNALELDGTVPNRPLVVDAVPPKTLPVVAVEVPNKLPEVEDFVTPNTLPDAEEVVPKEPREVDELVPPNTVPDAKEVVPKEPREVDELIPPNTVPEAEEVVPREPTEVDELVPPNTVPGAEEVVPNKPPEAEETAPPNTLPDTDLAPNKPLEVVVTAPPNTLPVEGLGPNKPLGTVDTDPLKDILDAVVTFDDEEVPPNTPEGVEIPLTPGETATIVPNLVDVDPEASTVALETVAPNIFFEAAVTDGPPSSEAAVVALLKVKIPPVLETVAVETGLEVKEEAILEDDTAPGTAVATGDENNELPLVVLVVDATDGEANTVVIPSPDGAECKNDAEEAAVAALLRAAIDDMFDTGCLTPVLEATVFNPKIIPELVVGAAERNDIGEVVVADSGPPD